jgi:hypothetical protein
MSAVNLVTLDTWAQNMVWLCGVSPIFGDLATVIQVWRVAQVVPLALDMTQDEKNVGLRLLTGFVSGTQTDLNCYPVGLETTFCFDLDGNPR